MSNEKNKSKSDKPKTDKPAAATGADAKPKKAKKPKDPNAVKLAWHEKQLKRAMNVRKKLTKLAGIVANHPKSGVSAELAQSLVAGIDALGEQIAAAGTYKPTVRAKIGVGSIVKCKRDAESLADKIFAVDPRTGKPYCTPELFDNVEIIDDDRTAWFVRDANGGVRSMKKYLAELA